MDEFYLGIDLGGTNIVAGVIDKKFNIISKAKTETKAGRTSEEIADDMAKTVFEALKLSEKKIEDLTWIGVGSPGAIDAKNGIVLFAGNLNFSNVPLAKMLEERLKKPVFLENDANSAAYGEFIAGACKGKKNSIMITLGTGVGGGIIIDGKIYSGFNFAGAELGHTVLEVNGEPCTCGRKGCFEAYSSATGLIKMTKKAMSLDKKSIMHNLVEKEQKVSGKTAFEAMRLGDETAKKVVDEYIKYLGHGVANLINIFQPQILCIGGGVSNEGENLLLPLKEFVKTQIFTRNLEENTEIVLAELGNDAGIIGAAFLGRLG